MGSKTSRPCSSTCQCSSGETPDEAGGTPALPETRLALMSGRPQTLKIWLLRIFFKRSPINRSGVAWTLGRGNAEYGFAVPRWFRALWPRWKSRSHIQVPIALAVAFARGFFDEARADCAVLGAEDEGYGL